MAKTTADTQVAVYKTDPESDKSKIILSGPQETLTMTLPAHASDAEFPSPILNDQLAVEITKLVKVDPTQSLGDTVSHRRISSTTTTG
ncbi:uncharacterized protein PpBr36_10267 [Pyricularia pennisetigena]|uniref:uncharacterized protein n=1 Tax=Pyricularia pennisetigena TaxID=1578925 RepID=UPI0011513CE3|nr:uncharacterized protein PpBr36_10267 [Pyricularia pennisetigena]TLS21384.1 hypothetical protein PpBr36_10267 [Pyricularia pennisetigena]